MTRARDLRDLTILKLLEAGWDIPRIVAAYAVTPGYVRKLFREALG